VSDALQIPVQMLSAIPFGLAAGFLLAKGDLCGAAAFSEVLLLRDRRKLFGLWTAAVASMTGFAILDGFGLVALNPRPFFWASALVGGTVFGIGMVLAGGCVTGTLYKCGVGHANSLLAIIFVPIGLWAVDLGPISPLDAELQRAVIDGPGGEPVSLYGLTGISYGVLTLCFVVATLATGLAAARRRRPPSGARPAPPTPGRWWRKGWSPWAAGAALGALSAPAWLAARAAGRDFALGVTDGVQQVGRLATGETVTLWPLVFAACLIPGAHLAVRLEGRAGLIRKPRERMVAAAIGGLLVGIGAGLGRGCVLGNGVTGAALMSVGMVGFVVVAMLANWATTRLWVIGF